MKVIIFKTPEELGQAAAGHIARKLREAIAQRGEARLVLSTGMSQFETFTVLVEENVDWSSVTMFHLDEYINLAESHPASFRGYLKQRFTSKVKLKEVHFVDGQGDVEATLETLNQLIGQAPIDVGVIGIGENAHIAFNDPPADFDRQDAYFVADLDERCRKQQVGEGWFATVDDVPKQAITMSVAQIMRCRTIVSAVPHKVKAHAVKATLESLEITNQIPATKLREHADWTLYLDDASASLINKKDYQEEE